jgi:heme exporter protein A
MQPALAAMDLACRRGYRLLFTQLSFSLRPGEALHVTGRNGTGKSSLLRILAGLSRPYAGKVESCGAIGLVDERAALDPDLPLQKALQYWFALDGARKRQDILATLALDEVADVPVRFLSTGQRKRAALARLAGQDAPLWLLDEPLSGLDAPSRAITERLLARHLSGGGVAVIASHQPFTAVEARVLDLEGFAPE